MEKNKIYSYNNMKTIREIYKAFNIKYDVRAARNLLNLPTNTPKIQVNKALKSLFFELIEDETYQPIYKYTLKGSKTDLRDSKQTNTSFTFQSKKKYKIYRMNIKGHHGGKDNMKFQNNFPTFDSYDIPDEFEDFIGHYLTQVAGGPTHYFNFTIENISRRKLPKKGKQLKDVPLYNPVVNLPYKEFNGFKDKGEMMCVPETILHHLQINGKKKKLILQEVIETLEEEYVGEEEEDFNISEEQLNFIKSKYPDENTSYERWCSLYIQYCGEYESPDEEYGKRGYTPADIVRTLEFYKCRGRLLDIHQNQFLTTNFDLKYNKKLLSFCGMVYDNHLYYCDNQEFVTSIGNVRNNSCFQEQVYEKKGKEFEDKKTYEIVGTDDLTDIYVDMFKNDKTIRLVKTQNGKIINILSNNHQTTEKPLSICANPEKVLMKEILGDNFNNQNTTSLGEEEFKEFFPTHNCSQFTKEVFDKLQKHGNIVESFNEPTDSIHFEYDINKCRTYCWMKNQLGDYEIFGVSAQIEDYKSSSKLPSLERFLQLKAGIYYVELESLKDREFFMRGNTWYSKQFIEIGLKEGYKVNIKYQLLATETLKADHFEKFVKHITEKYPNHFKHIINKCIGYRGKTQQKSSKGYVETDFDMAVAAFWDNNEDQIGFIDEKNIEQKKWKMMKGKLCNIHNLEVDENTTHYIVEFNEFKTLYENDLPIFNKILENEYLNVYNLKKRLGGKLIKIKTDAVVIEGKHNKIALSDKIGGIKFSKEFDIRVNIKEVQLNKQYNVDTSLNWNITTQQKDESINFPTGSCLVTGLAGFAKSTIVKQQSGYDEDTTLRLAFTNVATENISDATHPAHTLNSYFGINCKTGKCSEKKLKNMKNIKMIIISEIFLTPSYIMGHLSKIKNQFPHIVFICEGDPEQTRPVGEEKINWLETKLLFNLCDGNMLKMTINRRNDETENYYKILDGKELCSSKFSNREPQLINICRTNAMRVTINQELMEKDGYLIEKNKKNKYSQDIWLKPNTPIMCVKNNKKLNLKNGSRFAVQSVTKDKIVVGKNTFTDDVFSEYFVVCYAMTNHKIQGLTIKELYNIYEWKKMSIREKYTAYSRTSDGENVKINTDKKADYEFWNELQEFFNPNYCVYKWTSTKCNDIYIGHTKNFDARKKEHLRDAETKDNDLYKKMRTTGIETWTMEILKEFYAYDRSEAVQVEQKYIDEYCSNLNMCNAYKIKI